MTSQEPGAKHTGRLGTWVAGMMVTERVTPLARRSGLTWELWRNRSGAEGGTFCAVFHLNL